MKPRTIVHPVRKDANGGYGERTKHDKSFGRDLKTAEVRKCPETFLGVSEDNTKEIFLDAVKDKMVPMVEWIVSEFERTQLTQKQLSQRRKKDMGEDLFQTGKGATASQ